MSTKVHAWQKTWTLNRRCIAESAAIRIMRKQCTHKTSVYVTDINALLDYPTTVQACVKLASAYFTSSLRAHVSHATITPTAVEANDSLHKSETNNALVKTSVSRLQILSSAAKSFCSNLFILRCLKNKTISFILITRICGEYCNRR